MLASLTEGIDTSTPDGKMVFAVVGAVAELERSLIRERVKAGLRNAKAKGRHVGRPKVVLDHSEIACLRAQGRSLMAIGERLGVGEGAVRRLAPWYPPKPYVPPHPQAIDSATRRRSTFSPPKGLISAEGTDIELPPATAT